MYASPKKPHPPTPQFEFTRPSVGLHRPVSTPASAEALYLRPLAASLVVPPGGLQYFWHPDLKGALPPLRSAVRTKTQSLRFFLPAGKGRWVLFFFPPLLPGAFGRDGALFSFFLFFFFFSSTLLIRAARGVALHELLVRDATHIAL